MTRFSGRFLARARLAGAALGMALAVGHSPAAPPGEAIRLRVIGGLASVTQYLKHEEPFWTDELRRLSGGRYAADILPFDRAGIPGQDMLTLIRLGVVPFGTTLLGMVAGQYPELAGPDLAGLAPDVSSLRKVVDAFRPVLARTLRERHGAELLAVYLYPAQVLFCRESLRGLQDVAGRRTRVSSATQADFVRAVGGIPVLTLFTEITPSMRSGYIDCAITGAVSGNAIGLPLVARTVYTLPISWGLAVFGANSEVWRSLPEDLRSLLLRQMPGLEASIWEEAMRESAFDHACSKTNSCAPGTVGALNVVQPSAEDERLRRRIFERDVLPGWIARCGQECAQIWNDSIAAVVGTRASGDR